MELTPIVKLLSEKFKKEVEPEVLPEAQVIEKAAKTMASLAMITNHADIIHPGNIARYYQLPVEYGGFCPMAIIKRGITIPGDKNIGLLRYKDQLFAFETLESLLEFVKSPDS